MRVTVMTGLLMRSPRCLMCREAHRVLMKGSGLGGFRAELAVSSRCVESSRTSTAEVTWMSSRAFHTPSVNFMVEAVRACGCAVLPTREGATRDQRQQRRTLSCDGRGVEWSGCQGVVSQRSYFLVGNVSDQGSFVGPIGLLEV